MLSALERILGKLGEHDELGQVLARQAELADQPSARPTSCRRWGPCGSGRSTIQRGRSPRFETPSSATPRTPPLRRAGFTARSSRDAGRGARRPRAAGRDPGRLPGAGRALRPAGRLRDDRNERAHWLRRIAEVAADRLGQPELALDALGRALEKSRPRAARSTIWSRSPARPSFRPREPKESKRRWLARIPTPRRSWPCGPRACIRRPAIARPPSASIGGSSITTPRTSTPSRRWRRSTGRGGAGRAGGGARAPVGGRAQSSNPTVAAAGGGAAS